MPAHLLISLLLPFPNISYSSKGQLRILTTKYTKSILASKYPNSNQSQLYITDALALNPEEVPTIQLDTRDLVGRSNFSHFLRHVHSPPRFPKLEIMNVLQWDNVVLGNADLALGADRLKVAKKTANFQMLAENTLLQGRNWRKLLSF